jgi:hypothetical protein
MVTCTFAYTGAAQTWTVPAGLTSATFDALGAQGGGGLGTSGGLGGEATANLSLTPGATVTVVVGGQGGGICNGGAGFNGGGAGGISTVHNVCSGGGGGGGSDVRIGGSGLSDRVLVAGGGGGGGNSGSQCAPNGGGGGGQTGNAGTTGLCSSGGSGGNQDGSSGSGQLGVGGAGGSGSFGAAGGGGGGGYYGGAGDGSDGGGGGGGSGFTSAGTGMTNGVQSGDGTVTITYSLCAAGQALHLLTAHTNVGTINGKFCVNPTTGIGTYTQLIPGSASGTGIVQQHPGTTQIAAFGTNLMLAGNQFGSINAFGETAPVLAIGTFSLS